jgi:hypothetical protein
MLQLLNPTDKVTLPSSWNITKTREWNLMDPLNGVLAAIVDNVCVKAHELLPAALLVALEVVAAGALVDAHGMSLADTVSDVGTLTKRHREG